MLDALGLIKKHRGRGVFVDTSLLVLFLVGLVNRGRIGNFKRTGDFSTEDFELLSRLLEHFGKPLVATPYVLSQVSDLTDLEGDELNRIRKLFKATFETADERYDSAKKLMDSKVFERLGLADASIAAAGKREILVLTTDLDLYMTLQMSNFDSLNFNHVRPLNW